MEREPWFLHGMFVWAGLEVGPIPKQVLLVV